MATYDIDLQFISQSEGGQRLDGYVPVDHNGNILGHSGVTVATGVDLGQLTEVQLSNLDIPSDLKGKLRPYVGLHGPDAIKALEDQGLELTQEEANSLDATVHQSIFDQVAGAYDSATAAGAFVALPREAQTVIADLAIQYGPNLATRTPRFWGAVTDGRWENVVTELRNFGDAFPTRRNREADLLQSAIDRGAFSDN